jgi:hypothetical protein
VAFSFLLGIGIGGGGGGDEQVWDAKTRTRRSGQKTVLPHMARSLCWSPDAKHLAVGFAGGYFGVYDSETLLRLAWHHRTNQSVSVVRYSPNGRQVRVRVFCVLLL